MTQTTAIGMNVSLTPKLEELVREKVDSGLYNSASEVVREALRLLEEKDQVRRLKLDELRRLIQEGIDSGPSSPLDMNEVKQEARKLWEAKQNQNA